MALRRLLVTTWLVACAPGGDTSGTIEVTATVDRAASDFGVVRVRGLSPSERRRVEKQAAGVTVFASQDSVTSGTPPLSGSWRSVSDTIVFVPRFRPSSDVSLWVRVDRARLSRREPPGVQWWRFKLTDATGDTTPPSLVAIYPAADTVPENLLRWYLEFSHPMRPGQALDHVRLTDDNGADDPSAFLATSEELWNPEGTRLTLLFDPGRVKRGIRTNAEHGRPLIAGRTYRLRVNAGWQDMSGRALPHAIEKRLVVVTADHQGPNAAQWELQLPAVGTSEPLVVVFEDPVDHALGGRLIAVLDEQDKPVPGRVTLDDRDRRWNFTPSSGWRRARYQLQVSPELEDVAGNRPGLAFDHQATTTVGGAGGSPALVRWFEPRPQ